MKNLLNKVSLFLLLISFFSCSSKNKISDKGAISVFLNLKTLQKDQSLKNIKITIPDSYLNISWFGNNQDNQNIENFSLNNLQSNKDNILNVKNIWSGYSNDYNNAMVFAPVIALNKIYTLDAKSNLVAREISSQKIIWKQKLVKGLNLKNFINSKISYSTGKIFAISDYNTLFCIDAQNGKVVWQKTLSSLPASTPIADQNQVFLITEDNKTFALSLKSGEINWIHSGILKATGILGASNTVIYKNYIISSYSSGEIYALNKDNGEIKWVYDLSINKTNSSDLALNDIDATPIVKNEIVYTIGNGGLMMAIKINDGKVLWQKELSSITDFWIAGDFIYLINNDDQLICLYKNTGGIKWFNTLSGYINEKKSSKKIIYNGIIMVAGNLIVTNSNRELLLISPFDGKILQIKKLEQKIFHTPIVASGKIYLQTIGRFSTNLVLIE